ncbi:MAG: hypothetical protein EOO04_33355, partial [Chitinophagaceae bacterium]
MKKQFCLSVLTFLLIFFFPFTLFAQQSINGTLRSPTGEAIVGATVNIKGTDRSVITDQNGRFTITADSGTVLILSFVGFQSKEITVTGGTMNEILQ